MIDFKHLLNEKQYEAATYLDGHLRIIAGAGSGKTRVITYRIAYLIDHVGIAPQRILAITFTNKAANEMKSRVANLLGDTSIGTTICTIHSLCVRILRRHIHYLGYPSSFVIMDEDDQKALLKNIYKELKVDTKAFSYNQAISFISRMKNANLSPQKLLKEAQDYIEIISARVYGAYISYQNEHYLLDFDDLLLKANQVLESFENVKAYWTSCFDYIHVDEYQDVDAQDFRLLKNLTSDHTIVCVVGDPDQTIYSFRGADISYILDFDTSFKGAKDIYLNENYRSTNRILQAANHLIGHNTQRLEKDLYTQNDDGVQIVHYTAESDEAQGNYVVDKIEELIASIEGINYSNFAILYRANYLSRMIEHAMMKAHIPYRIYGGIKFFNRKEIKDLLSYLRLMVVGDDLAFERIINTPSRKIGAKTIEKIKDDALRRGLTMYQCCTHHLQDIGLGKQVVERIAAMIQILEKTTTFSRMAEGYEYLVNATGYMAMLQQDHDEARIQNVLELKNAIEAYEHEAEDPTWENYLQDIALYSSLDEQPNEECVQMMTIHMAKGLEFDYVFVVGLSENIFPSQRSIEEGGFRGVEEERRLAYVAFTRAKKQLFLVDSLGFSFVSDGPKRKSRFISEIGEENVIHEGAKSSMDRSPVFTLEVEECEDEVDTNQAFSKGDLIFHDVFGQGVIISIDRDMLNVAFKVPHGIKTIMANHPSVHLLNKD